MGFAMLDLLASSLLSFQKAEPWRDCLYNNKSIECRRTFLCEGAPCGRFEMEWKDGLNDVFTRYRDGVVRNVGYYTDSRGGQWILQGYADAFALVNLANNNTIIFNMTLRNCRQSPLSDRCP